MQKTISVKLTPGASSERIVEAENGELLIYVTTIPEDGKANKAMLKALSKYLSVPISSLEIIKGHKNRNKIVKIT